MSRRRNDLTQEFEQCRARLLRVAYAIIGTYADAEDVVAECWIRLDAADQREPIRDVEGWTVTAVARSALDVLRSARRQRELYVGPWLPEPLVTFDASPNIDPAAHVEMTESVSYALTVALEALTPPERMAWVLHDVFGVPFSDIATAMARKVPAVRQLAHRARGQLTRITPLEVTRSANESRELVSAFLTAAQTGDIERLSQMLDPSIIVTSDGGGKVVAARKPITGRERAAQFLTGIAGWVGTDDSLMPVTVNGGPGFALFRGAQLASVSALDVVDCRIVQIFFVLAPAKLDHLSHLYMPRE